MIPRTVLTRIDATVERLAMAYARRTEDDAERALTAFRTELLAQWRLSFPLPAKDIAEMVDEMLRRVRKRRREIGNVPPSIR